MSDYNRHKWAMEWMHGGGRDPNGRSLDEEIKIGKEDWLESQRVTTDERIGFESGQLVQPGPGRQGYAESDQTSATKRATHYKKLLENLPEGYYNEYVENFYTVNKDTGKLTHVSGGPKEKGIPYMEKKYGDIIKETYKTRQGETTNLNRKVRNINAAIKQSISDKIESGLKASRQVRKADLKIIGNWQPQAPAGKVTHHFMPLAGIEGEGLNLASTKNTAFISEELNSKMAPYDTKLKANQKEQIKLLKEKPQGWEKKIEDLNIRSRGLVTNSRKKVPGSAGYLGYSEITIKPDGTYTVEVRGNDYNKTLAGLDGEEIFYKNITKENQLKVNKMSNIKPIPKEKVSKDFLKLAPPKSTTKTIPAATTKGRIDEALKGDTFKGLRNLLKGELWFAAADFLNNLTKGQDIEKAFKKAVETASFDIKDLGADETAVIKHAIAQGASEEEAGALRNYLNYMKKYKTYERANKMLHYAKENLGQGTGSPEDIGTTRDDVISARENLKLREGELENLYNIYAEGTQDMQLGKNMLTKYMNTLAAEEWNKTAGTLIDRGSRTKQGEGLVWNPIGALTRDIGGLFSGKMPTEFYDATIGRFPSLLDPRIKEKEKQIRIMERPAVGVEYPEYQQALEDMKFDFGYALPEQNYAGGGIASLLKKK